MKSKLSRVVIASTALGLSLVIFMLAIKNSPEKKSPPSADVIKNDIPTIALEPAQKKSQIRSEDECSTKTSNPLASVPLRSVLESNLELDVWHGQAFRSPLAVLDKAKAGDALAAVGYFKMAMSCSPLSNDANSHPAQANCPVGISRAEAFTILERAAAMGNIEAQTTFAVNAPFYASWLQNRGTNEAVIEAAKLTSLSEAYGAAAAQAGSEEAMSFMSRSYLTGLFGAKDIEKGYRYLLPLSRLAPSPSMTELMHSIARNLAPEAKTRAEELAFGCVPTRTPLSNPFQSK